MQSHSIVIVFIGRLRWRGTMQEICCDSTVHDWRRRAIIWKTSRLIIINTITIAVTLLTLSKYNKFILELPFNAVPLYIHMSSFILLSYLCSTIRIIIWTMITTAAAITAININIFFFIFFILIIIFFSFVTYFILLQHKPLPASWSFRHMRKLKRRHNRSRCESLLLKGF